MVIRVKNETVSVNTYTIYEVKKSLEISERHLIINTERSLLLTEKQKAAVLKKGKQIFDRLHNNVQYPKNVRFSDEND